jgi:carbonic anhydrase
MGHSRCGAVAASLDAIQGKGVASANIADIVERIRPAVEAVLQPGVPRDELIERAIWTNVEMSVRELRTGSRILQKLIADGRLLVTGAEYSLDSGEVAFFKETDRWLKSSIRRGSGDSRSRTRGARLLTSSRASSPSGRSPRSSRSSTGRFR